MTILTFKLLKAIFCCIQEISYLYLYRKMRACLASLTFDLQSLSHKPTLMSHIHSYDPVPVTTPPPTHSFLQLRHKQGQIMMPWGSLSDDKLFLWSLPPVRECHLFETLPLLCVCQLTGTGNWYPNRRVPLYLASQNQIIPVNRSPSPHSMCIFVYL